MAEFFRPIRKRQIQPALRAVWFRASHIRAFAGFSLVEVVLALGICAFALISLLSLTPISLDAARHASEITRITKAFQEVSSELTQNKFTNVQGMTATSWYFDYDGNALPVTNPPTAPLNTYYTVTATVAASPVANQASTSLLRIQLNAQTRSKFNLLSSTITVCDMGY